MLRTGREKWTCPGKRGRLVTRRRSPFLLADGGSGGAAADFVAKVLASQVASAARTQ